MSYSNDISDTVRYGKEKIEKEGKQAFNEGKKQIKQGGEDWWNYVESHPLQTLVFGVVGYFALKGMFKK